MTVDLSRKLGAVIGQNLRSWREEVACSQDDLANRMQRSGLSWRQPTVARVELGKREITLTEFLVLCTVTGRPPAAWLDSSTDLDVVVGDGPQTISLEVLRGWLTDGEGPAPRAPLRDVLRGAARQQVADRGYDRRAEVAAQTWMAPDDVATLRAITLEAAGDAEIKASRSLKRSFTAAPIDPPDIAAIAHAMWGHGLVVERDRRFARKFGETDDPRSAQALRGRVTRELLDEMAGRVADMDSRLREEAAQDRLENPDSLFPILLPPPPEETP